MCGRSRCALAPQRVEQVTGVPQERWVDKDRYQPSYNASPGAWTPILRLDTHDQSTRVLQTMRWGLIPSFTKPGSHLDFYKMFNARSESAAEKPVFSRLLSSHRCVVLLEGFYEWKADAGGKKQPYFISFGEPGCVVYMAGLYDVFLGAEGGPLTTYTIMTVDSAPQLRWLHDRMPVILDSDRAVQAWLTGTDSKPQAAPMYLCAPCDNPALCWHPVTAAMNKPNYNKPDASTDVRKKKGAITSFFKPSTTPVKSRSLQQVNQAKMEGQHTIEQHQQHSDPEAKNAAVRNTDEQQGATTDDDHAAAAAAAAVLMLNEPLHTPPCPVPAAAAAAENVLKRRKSDEGEGEADDRSAVAVQEGAMKRMRA